LLHVALLRVLELGEGKFWEGVRLLRTALGRGEAGALFDMMVCTLPNLNVGLWIGGKMVMNLWSQSSHG
jgi:hypothetical protein